MQAIGETDVCAVIEALSPLFRPFVDPIVDQADHNKRMDLIAENFPLMDAHLASIERHRMRLMESVATI